MGPVRKAVVLGALLGLGLGCISLGLVLLGVS